MGAVRIGISVTYPQDCTGTVRELEFVDIDGSRQAEADLIALVDDRLVVAEAKYNDTFGSGKKLRRAAAKRVQLAQALRADEIVFATTLILIPLARRWPASSMTHCVRHCGGEHG